MSAYTKLRLLGEGSHAKVYLAVDAIGNQYALKEFLLGEDEEYDEMQSRFLVEKTVLENIHSLNVIKIVDTVETGLELSIVMELCEHGSLKSQLQSIGPFSLERAIKSGLSILNGLEAMHEAGYQHRDLKPDNILQGEGGVLKIADMGLARGTDFENKYCQGSVAYMSPEQHTNYNHVDDRTDIYSLGATLYHIYTGKELFYGESIEDILDSHKNCITPSLKDSRSDCPLTFNHVVRKMIAKSPADRYQTANEARLDLEAVLDGVEGINQLPSIQNIKTLADTLTEADLPVSDSSTKKQKKALGVILALIVVLCSAALLLPSKSRGLEVKEVNDTSPETVGFIPEVPKEKPESVLPEDFEVVEPEPERVPDVKQNSAESSKGKDISVEKEKLPKIKKDEIVYIGPVLRTFPFQLTEVTDDSLSCKLLSKGKESQFFLAQKSKHLHILAIRDSKVTVEYRRQAYELNLNKQYKVFNGLYRVRLNGKDVFISLDKSHPHLKLLKGSLKEIVVMNKHGKALKLKASEGFESPLKALDSTRVEKLKIQSKGGVLQFVEMKPKVFPFLLTGVSGDKIQILTDDEKKSVHKKSEIILSRLQIVKINNDSAEFRDIRTSKTYKLFKDQKYILQKGAVYSYKGEKHTIYNGSEFLGYKVNFADSEVVFKGKNDLKVPFSYTKSRVFLPQAK